MALSKRQQHTTLGDYLQFQRGISWDRRQERNNPDNGAVPVLRIPNVRSKLVLDDLLYLKTLGLGDLGRFEAKHGTILMVGSNGNPARVGNAVFVDHDRNFLFASFLIGAQLRSGANADSKFLFHFISSPRLQDKITRSVQGSTGLKNLSLAFLEALLMPTLSVTEQRKIAEVLDTLDDVIRTTEKLIAKLEKVKQGLLHDLLTRGIDENGELRDPVRHPEQFKDSVLGRIPMSWEAMPLSEIADFDVGYAFKSEWFSDYDGVRLLRGENVGYGKPDWSQTKKLPDKLAREFPEYLLNPNDIIIGMDRTFTQKGVKVSMVRPCDSPALLVQRVGRFVPNDVYYPFLTQLLQWPKFHRELLAQQKGMDIPHLSKTEILSPFVPVPETAEQEAIAKTLVEMMGRQRKEKAQLEKLQLLKQGLMEDLLTGRVRVTPLLSEADP